MVIRTQAEFFAWLPWAARGKWDVYHVGALAVDTHRASDIRLISLAAVVWEAAKQGRVHLFQKALGDGRYEYRVMKA